jgi:hypothetical protein
VVAPGSSGRRWSSEPARTEARFPIAFSDDWASDDDGETWVKVWRGHPKKGQLIERID